MMTKPSSSQLGMQIVLLDSISRPVVLGKQIGRGGEGAVYEIDGEPTLVAKVYHKMPLPEDQVAKLQAMAASWSSALETIAAWPRSLLYDSSSRKPAGILMTKMDVAKPLHELYGTTNRRRHFPDVGWHHLVLAARNAAAAFQTLHNANIIVGDVNQGNLLVDNKMCVRMIDCDSFQLTTGGRTFNCPVGTPHFTPPELQSLKLRDVARTANHDRFGLAVLIFHLLFVGRHPFAGRYRGTGDLSIEKAIAERRFAFSRNCLETLVDPPPASLVIEDLPASVGNLFEAAFRSTGDDANPRPTPLQWVQELETLMKYRRSCNFDPVHVYYSQLAECPWCRIEDSGGPAFFVAAGGQSIISADRLNALDERIWDLRQTTFPDLAPQLIAPPTMPVIRALKQPPKRSAPDWIADAMVASWLVCLAGIFLKGSTGGIAVAAGAALSCILALVLLFAKSTRGRRRQSEEFEASLEAGKERLANMAKGVEKYHLQREEVFERSTGEIKHKIELYRNADKDLHSVIAQHRELQKSEYLRGFSVRDCYRQIRNLTPSQVIMLESFGVETAYDVDRIRLYGIPSIDPETVVELLQWRWEKDQAFVFNPEHGITLADVGAQKDAAVRRFKISQARNILTGAKQVETLADVGAAELARNVGQYEAAVEQWKSHAKQYRDFQSGRRPAERLINHSPAPVIGLSLGVPLLLFFLYLMFG